uniref:phage tail tube protein n=1 Tax=Nocardia suismassiliense TaxID=2077092 RepID=UPI003F497C65
MALPTTLNIGAGTPNIKATGGILVAPIGTTLPTTAAANPNAAFKALGYVSEDGLESQGERTVESVKDWNADIIAQLQTEHSVRWGLTLYAYWDADVLTEVFGAGDNVVVTGPTPTAGTLIKVTETGAVLPKRAWILDMKHEAKKLRIVLPNAKISQVSENAYAAGNLLGFQITIEAFPDSTGAKAYRYLDDGVPVP